MSISDGEDGAMSPSARAQLRFLHAQLAHHVSVPDDEIVLVFGQRRVAMTVFTFVFLISIPVGMFVTLFFRSVVAGS